MRGGDKLGSMLDDIQGRGDDLESFEVQNLATRIGMQQLRRKASSATPLVEMGRGMGKPTDAAQFDITVTRTNVTGAGLGSLDFALFGTVDIENKYQNFLTPPSGGTLVITGGFASNLPDRIKFRYSNAGATIVVDLDITCNQMEYPSFLKATGNDVFRLSKIRYSISDVGQLSQFNQKFKIIERSLFGLRQENTLSVGAYKRPEQFQNGIIDLNTVIIIDKSTTLLLGINDLSGFSVNLSMFVEKFNKLGKGDL